MSSEVPILTTESGTETKNGEKDNNNNNKNSKGNKKQTNRKGDKTKADDKSGGGEKQKYAQSNKPRAERKEPFNPRVDAGVANPNVVRKGGVSKPLSLALAGSSADVARRPLPAASSGQDLSAEAILGPTNRNFFVGMTENEIDGAVEKTEHVITVGDILSAITDTNQEAILRRLKQIGIEVPMGINQVDWIRTLSDNVIASQMSAHRSNLGMPFVENFLPNLVIDSILGLDEKVVADFWAAFDATNSPSVGRSLFVMSQTLEPTYVPNGTYNSVSVFAWRRVIRLYTYFRANPGALQSANPLDAFADSIPHVAGGFSFRRFAQVIDTRHEGIDLCLTSLDGKVSGSDALFAVARKFTPV